jgi:uncharacterized repeat protein (TIGR03803 family)
VKTAELTRIALCVSAAVALLAACGGSQPPIVAPGEMPPYAHSNRGAHGVYHVLVNFRRRNGREPYAGLTDVGAVLYGTTWTGGPHLWGTVFSIGANNKEQVLHGFGDRHGGEHPEASLVDVNGTLYGTTYSGGAYRKSGYGCGTVFSITGAGDEQDLFNFDCGSEGANPQAPLLDINGALYGTTDYGGAYGAGTVFSISPAGKESVVYSFGTSKTDGALPRAGLLYLGGTLYGTTSEGGAYGYGTVFSLGISGGETVLHSLGYGSDGAYPFAALIDDAGTLYGTTISGGAYGRGTVFSISMSGTEAVLHSFGSGSDGVVPEGSLLEVSGTLYGTTSGGGQYADQSGGNGGTIFSISASGDEEILHSFGKGNDGQYPEAGLIGLNGTLFGTTVWGGRGGFGNVFSLRL